MHANFQLHMCSRILKLWRCVKIELKKGYSFFYKWFSLYLWNPVFFEFPWYFNMKRYLHSVKRFCEFKGWVIRIYQNLNFDPTSYTLNHNNKFRPGVYPIRPMVITHIGLSVCPSNISYDYCLPNGVLGNLPFPCVCSCVCLRKSQRRLISFFWFFAWS